MKGIKLCTTGHKISQSPPPPSGGQIYRLVPLRALKSKMVMVRNIAVPFRVLSRKKNMTEYVLCCLKLVPLRGKNIFESRSSNKILVPFSVFFENF